MSKTKSGSKESKRFLGTYTLPEGQSVVGNLRLTGASTLLKLHSDEPLQEVECGAFVHGVSFNNDYISLIDCRTHETERTGIKDGSIKYHAEIFPHYVAVGHQHLNPGNAYIAEVHFTTTDLFTLFYDFDVFGQVINTKPIIDMVLGERRAIRPVEAGELPVVLYFTGKDCIVEVQTAIGKVSVHHRPSYSIGGPTGVYIKNRIVVSIKPESPLTFDTAIERMYDVCCFLSIAAGRGQGVESMYINTTEVVNGVTQALRIYQSYRFKPGGSSETIKPHPGDVPLNPINHMAEFSSVLSDWIARHEGWRVARGRYLGCLRKANKYGAERLVAAANMFDILPATAVPSRTQLENELAKTRDDCCQMLRKLPQSVDRDGALSAMGRLGQPSLLKKVAHRASIVEEKLGARFPDLQFAASIAIKCRNFFVHGSSVDFDFEKVEPLLHFLTDALEFIFAASDFIEAGWDTVRWDTEPKGSGHTFARFRLNYDMMVRELRRAIAEK